MTARSSAVRAIRETSAPLSVKSTGTAQPPRASAKMSAAFWVPPVGLNVTS